MYTKEVINMYQLLRIYIYYITHNNTNTRIIFDKKNNFLYTNLNSMY